MTAPDTCERTDEVRLHIIRMLDLARELLASTPAGAREYGLFAAAEREALGALCTLHVLDNVDDSATTAKEA